MKEFTQVTQIHENTQSIAVMAKDLEYIKSSVDDIKDDLRVLTKSLVTVGSHETLEKRVAKIESNLGWVIKLVVGMVLTAVISFVLIK